MVFYRGVGPAGFEGVQLSEAQPIGRMAEPSEIAKLALYLCSEDASFITGQAYEIDGGYMNLRG